VRALVLGGAGDMGRQIAGFLASWGRFDEVQIGDVSRERGEAVASELGGKCSYRFIDVREPKLAELLKGYDVVLNAVGPFYEFGPLVAKAAIEAGVGLVDICDDYDAAERILGLHDEAKARAVAVITGVGWTPGLSNLLAKLAYERLGGADAIRICWVGSAADSRGLAVIMHLLYAITGQVPMYLNGQRTLVEAGSGREEVLYPPPIGIAPAYYTGHPEPVTLPIYLRGLREVEVKGGLVPSWQNGLGRLFVKLRLTTTPARRRRLSKFLHSIEGIFRSGGVECSAVRVEAHGPSGSLVLAAADRMGRLTGMPAAQCAEAMATGEVGIAGCYAPEGCLDASRFLRALGSKGLKVFELKGEAFEEAAP
jgi:lysine 6-dehydrogenase